MANESARAKDWLEANPQLLLDRAAALADNPRTLAQAIAVFSDTISTELVYRR